LARIVLVARRAMKILTAALLAFDAEGIKSEASGR
jgi:hypothetical protein